MRVTGTFLFKPPSSSATLADIHEGRPSTIFGVVPVPPSLERCSGSVCVTVEARVEIAAPDPLVSDGESGVLHDAVVIARSRSCEPPSVTADIDRESARSALHDIAGDLDRCRADGGPIGEGHVTITFYGDGRASAANVDRPPYAGTAVGACVERMFRTARVPAFSGSRQIGTTFSVR